MDIGSFRIDFLKTFLIFTTSLTVTLLILPRLLDLAHKIGLLDYPDLNLRKIHDIPKPLIGGLSIIIALSISCPLFVPLAHLKGFFIGLIILGIVGFLDDSRKNETSN